MTKQCYCILFQVLDRDNQIDNPCSGWLSDSTWDNVTELDKLANFHGIITSFEQYPRDWNIWYTSSTPECTSLPGECVCDKCVRCSLYCEHYYLRFMYL